jgi:hypothetical protein
MPSALARPASRLLGKFNRSHFLPARPPCAPSPRSRRAAVSTARAAGADSSHCVVHLRCLLCQLTLTNLDGPCSSDAAIAAALSSFVSNAPLSCALFTSASVGKFSRSHFTPDRPPCASSPRSCRAAVSTACAASCSSTKRPRHCCFPSLRSTNFRFSYTKLWAVYVKLWAVYVTWFCFTLELALEGPPGPLADGHLLPHA